MPASCRRTDITIIRGRGENGAELICPPDLQVTPDGGTITATMFLPYNTDAPIYHWPYATIGLIAVNTIVFANQVTQGLNFETIEPWTLQYGQGLHPVQWVTANFLHADLMHLLGNMFALWGFGLVVEGKIGWWRFLAVYPGMGIGQCMLEQVLVPTGLANCSLGASGVIFGLMAISLIWAPMNEMSCFVFIIFRPILFDITVWGFALLMAGLQLLTAWLSGMTYGSESLHAIGAGFGLVVGVVMLKNNMVDCENWDIFSVWAGRHRMSSDQLNELRALSQADQEKKAHLRKSSLEQIKQIIIDGRHELAYAAHQKMSRTFDDWRLPEPHFRKMIAGYHRAQQYNKSIPLMVEYLQTYTEQASLVRLKLTEILLRHERRPAQARRVLAKIPDDAINAAQSNSRQQLEAWIALFPPDNILEVEPEDW